ncbi:MAG: lipoyl synthase [Chloroflexota bacterium]
MKQDQPKRRPEWIKVRSRSSAKYDRIRELVRKESLHTVCEEARCPNRSECWGESGTATFMILGDTCTRSCKFCNVNTGRPSAIDWDEPKRIANAVRIMNLNHAVITSVTRDDYPDGGALVFARCIERIRQVQPECTVEVLIPDFRGEIDSLNTVIQAKPDILNHNVETVKRLFREVQPQDKYEWAKATLCNAKKLNPDQTTKSGIMVGLGEEFDEVVETMSDLREWGVDILTIGQYLQPTKHHLPIDRYYHPDEFESLRAIGYELGFSWVESGPLVRSSYHAAEQMGAKKPPQQTSPHSK